MNIQLEPELEQFIQTQMATGRYASTSEVINQTLNLLEQLENAYQRWLQESRHKVEVVINRLEQGQN